MKPWPANMDPEPTPGLPYNVPDLLLQADAHHQAKRFGLYRNALLDAAKVESKHNRHAAAMDKLLLVAFIDTCGPVTWYVLRQREDVASGVLKMIDREMDWLRVGKRQVIARFVQIASEREWIPEQLDPEKARRKFVRVF
jgi:hypothetical protein